MIFFLFHVEIVIIFLVLHNTFFLSHNYHDNFKGGKWNLEKLRSQILLTDLKILWCRVMMSCFGCISLECEYQTSCHKYRHFTHFSNRLLAPHISPFPTPNFSVYICYDMTLLPSQRTLMGLFLTYLIPFFLRKIRVTMNQGFISFFNAIIEGFTLFKNRTGSSWG